MMNKSKTILGLDLGTNSIGWALVESNFDKKEGEIINNGVRIIPMDQGVLGKFGEGNSISQTADRTKYRGTRRLYQRDNLRRERLHRVLNVIDFLPKHYANFIDFEKRLGQFKKGEEVKLNYIPTEEGSKNEFLFKDSFLEMVNEFKAEQPQLFYKKNNGKETKIPYDWTIYYLRKKALTQKISKEELAWLLLNFNQKRGYYQLRGEEEEITEGKIKSFETLYVDRVEKTEDVLKKTGEILFNVYFDNGWKYEKQTTKPENWLNRYKEFIVTTSTLKDGTIKRSFKVVDSEKDWIAIKKKTENDIFKSNKTVGEFVYNTLLQNPSQKINGKLVKTIERKFYKEELQQILETQIKCHPELKNKTLYKNCIKELYPRNIAHQNNILNKKEEEMFRYLFMDDIIFYQRPLKSKKSNIGTCPYEFRYFIKKDEKGIPKKEKEGLKVIPKSNPYFIEFRLWQFIHNLKIFNTEVKNDIEVTQNLLTSEEDIVALFDFLNTKKEIEQKHIIKYFVDTKKIEKREQNTYRWNYVEDRKYPINETRNQFLNRLKKVKDVDAEFFLTRKKEQKLWHLVYSVTDIKEFEAALGTFAIKNNIDKKTFVEAFKKHPPYSNDYAAYSEKAIKKLLPLMRRGKYWNETEIYEEVKQRIYNIYERIAHLKIVKSSKIQETTLQEAIALVSDDEIPKQFIKSFLNHKLDNPLTGLNTYQACYAVYEQHSEASIIKPWKSPKDIDTYLNTFKQHSLRNPIVEQVVLETLRTVRDIWQYNLDQNSNFKFDEIHLELGRDMKNSAKKRESITKRKIENEKTNTRIKMLLEELKNEGAKVFSPSHQEILKIYEEGIVQNPDTKYNEVKKDEIEKIRKNAKPSSSEIKKYKLWLEQKYVSPYTGLQIPLSKLFSHEYEIEHIIPQSRYFDNSMTNKIICEADVNRDKSNKTAYEYLKEKGGSIVEGFKLLSISAYEEHCSNYFKENRTKLKNLLSEDIPEGFINRQLNDSRYIAKLIKGLLSNIVREEGEKEVTAKKLIPISGAITSKLKHDWGLNDQWNKIIQPRFERLNNLQVLEINEIIKKIKDEENIAVILKEAKKVTGFEINEKEATKKTIILQLNELKHYYGYLDYQKDKEGSNIGKQFFRLIAPKGVSKKRIDHRHHTLDAIVIACCSRKHIQYLNSLRNENKKYELQPSLMIKNKQGNYTKQFLKPWDNFTIDVLKQLETTTVSFKKNTRVITKTNNKTWQWRTNENGKLKKKLVLQTKGDSRAIRKPLHDDLPYAQFNITANNKGKVVTGIRKSLSELNPKRLEKIEKLDKGMFNILTNHLDKYKHEKKPFESAFNQEGVEKLNATIISLNNGKNHQPIYKFRLIEESERFRLSKNMNSSKSKKMMKTGTGTNLFFTIYWDKKNKKRVYETIPLHEVIDWQKWRVKNKVFDEPMIPINEEKGKFLFSLSPNDLVYVPTIEEQENPNIVDFNNLTKDQTNRIYKMVSTTGNECHFIPVHYSASIIKNENGSNNKNERCQLIHLTELDNKSKPKMIKSICWKLEVNRLGQIQNNIK